MKLFEKIFNFALMFSLMIWVSSCLPMSGNPLDNVSVVKTPVSLGNAIAGSISISPIDIEEARKIICKISNSIDSESKEGLAIEALFYKSGDIKTKKKEIALYDIVSGILIVNDVPLTSKGEQYYNYVKEILNKTCQRLKFYKSLE